MVEAWLDLASASSRDSSGTVALRTQCALGIKSATGMQPASSNEQQKVTSSVRESACLSDSRAEVRKLGSKGAKLMAGRSLLGSEAGRLGEARRSRRLTGRQQRPGTARAGPNTLCSAFCCLCSLQEPPFLWPSRPSRPGWLRPARAPPAGAWKARLYEFRSSGSGVARRLHTGFLSQSTGSLRTLRRQVLTGTWHMEGFIGRF